VFFVPFVVILPSSLAKMRIAKKGAPPIDKTPGIRQPSQIETGGSFEGFFQIDP
jgi:hypothetical protein